MGNLSNILGGPWSPPPERVPDPPEIQLQQAIADAGLTPPDHVVIDGHLHRFASGSSGKSGAGSKSGWYIAFPDGIPAGRFGCWRADIDQTWRADVGRTLEPAEEMAITRRSSEARAERDRQRALVQDAVADVVARIWADGALASSEHPYIRRKGIQPHGARITGDGRLMVPMYDPDGNLVGLQYIAADGEKRYHSGSKASGAQWAIGAETDRTLIAEGYATAATLHEVTGDQAVVAYSASNLPKVAEAVRRQRGQNHRIIIVADHDEHQVGRNHADQASALTGAGVVMPPIPGMDANDYHLEGHDLHALLNPPREQDWLIPADEMASQPAPIAWLVKHWLQSSALIMVHGPSGGGKTFAVLDWALRIASPGFDDWRGHKVRPGAVVYLAGEGHHGLRGRLAAWRQHHRVTGQTRMWVSRSGCNLNTPEGYQQALEAIRALPEPPRLIVVDTLHRFLEGDENSAQDAKTMLDACAGLMTEFGCSALLVHHTGVSDEAQHRARGSSAWRGALDIEISVVPPKGGEGAIEIIQRKSKDAELAESVWCELQPVPISGWLDEDGEQVTSAVMVESVAPVRSDKSSKLEGYMKTFAGAWWASRCEVQDGKPYVTRSALKNELLNVAEGKKPSARTIENELSASYKDRLIGSLVGAGLIERVDHGWVIIDESWSSALMIDMDHSKKCPPP